MRIGEERQFHLTYCSNIHPSRGWKEILGNLERYAVALKMRLAPDVPFGLGLRLSSDESHEALEGDRLGALRALLDERRLYLFTLNGFPYGAFHGERIKERVFAPDWSDPARLDYTLRLIRILAALLPEGVEGSISTLPLSYKRWIADGGDPRWDRIIDHLVEVAAALVLVRRTTGREIHLDLEPEPDGLIERCDEVVAFFEQRLLPIGGSRLADRLGIARGQAEAHLRDRIQICFDTAHLSVAFEEMDRAVDRLIRAGIRIGKVQISNALEVALTDRGGERDELLDALRPFADATYLHQVIGRDRQGRLSRYPDLGEALRHLKQAAEGRWRIHFHLPLFMNGTEPLSSTREDTQTLLRRLRREPFTQHLEIETYTQSVLPSNLKMDLTTSIEREYRWVLHHFNAKRESTSNADA